MNSRFLAATLIVLSASAPVFAHRLDEYLQATAISLEKNRVHAQTRLTPGVAVFDRIMDTIDTNGDRAISPREQQAYAERVLADLSLIVDGDRLKLQLISASFPTVEAMKDGLGEIHIDFAADLRHDRPKRRLVFENRHATPISTYLVNCLVPEDSEIRIVTQNRNYEQSVYQMDYVQDGVGSGPGSLYGWLDDRGFIASFAIALLAPAAILWRKRKS
jgi:hypothetical protein